MKTAISLPDDLFESADQLAGELGISRSSLYATALAEYLAKHRHTAVTERLNQVYRNQSGSVHKAVRAAQAKSVRADEW